MKRWTRVAATVAAGVLAAPGCGFDDHGGGGDGGGTGGIRNAKVIEVNAMKDATGTVTYCTGKDTTGETREWSRRFDEKYAAQGLSVRIVEFPASADEQRNRTVQRQEAKAADCDVFRSDVTRTAEFASQGWLYDLTPHVESIRDRFIAAQLETAFYENVNRVLAGQTSAEEAMRQARADIEEALATF